MTLLMSGMHGMGDTIHERAIVRQLLQRGETVYLETSWPCVFHDLIGPRLKLIAKKSGLRTQAKNAQREAASFSALPLEPAPGLQYMRIWYRPEDVRRHGSVLAAMATAAGCDPVSADFRLPVPEAWRAKAAALMDAWRPRKPIMIYRPLVERSEWGGCAARNPDHAAYAELLRAIRDRFFLVSIADLVPGQEWTVGELIEADATYHAGEIDFETIAALTEAAELVFTSPGFAVILAQAVGTPVACVFGGYESGRSFSGGARFAPYLAIEPMQPCECFLHNHGCIKAIDMPRATSRLQEFAA